MFGSAAWRPLPASARTFMSVYLLYRSHSNSVAVELVDTLLSLLCDAFLFFAFRRKRLLCRLVYCRTILFGSAAWRPLPASARIFMFVYALSKPY